MDDHVAGKITLTKGHVKPIACRHPWVFASAVGRVEGSPAPGGLVSVHDGVGRFLAKGYYSPQSNIRVKLFSWDQSEKIDGTFWHRRLSAAVALRAETLGLTERRGACRLVNAEGDWAPGLIVDRYGDFLVVEFLTAGTASRAEMFVDVLWEIAKPLGIIERPEAGMARSEGISRAEAVLRGEEPPELTEITEGRANFLVDLRKSQKTGFYLDQRENRIRAAEFAKGRRVLDAFCYTGGFAVHAALAGAQSVCAVDSSGASLEIGRKNAQLNGVQVEFVDANVFERLRMMKVEGQAFDMIILDPPKLAQNRAGIAKALRAHKDANLSALKIIEPNGILVTCTCSGLISRDVFLRALTDAACDTKRNVTVIEHRGASPDHPFSPACPETAYLQCLITHVE
jgi:23S rRNA (cytosine1962-C5)-methyltransferase